MPNRHPGPDRTAAPVTNARVRDAIFDLRSLEISVGVLECGSMTLAAQRLGLTQSGVSHAIAALEKGLGTELLDRRVRPIAPTAGGRVLLERAEGLLRDARETALRVGLRLPGCAAPAGRHGGFGGVRHRPPSGAPAAPGGGATVHLVGPVAEPHPLADHPRGGP